MLLYFNVVKQLYVKKEEVDFSIEFCQRKKFKYNMHACNTHAKVGFFFLEKLTKGHANDSILTLKNCY